MSMNEKVYVITMRIGQHIEEFVYYTVLVCRSEEVAEQTIATAEQLYREAIDGLKAPPWDVSIHSLEWNDYKREVKEAEERLVKAYMEMFPLLQTHEHRNIFVVDEDIDFYFEEVPIV